MQDYRSITSNFSVAGFLGAGDLEKIQAMGFSTVVNNLPDEEVSNGYTSHVAKADAEALGMDYIYFPVTGASLIEQANIDKFSDMLSDTDLPVFTHCKTGVRSSILWGLASSQNTPPAKILGLLESAGLDLDYLDDDFEEQWEITSEKSAEIAPAPTTIQHQIAAGCIA